MAWRRATIEGIIGGMTVQCEECDGEGEVPEYGHMEDCRECSGSGRILTERGHAFYKFLREGFEKWLSEQKEVIDL